MGTSVTFHVKQLESLDESRHPWKPILRELIDREVKPIEAIFPFNGFVHFVKRNGENLTVTSLAGDNEARFASMRTVHTALVNRFRKHIEGLIHNLRSPLSGIRSRTELLAQYVESTDLSNPEMLERLFNQIQRSTGRVLDASDQLNEQLRTFDQVFRWLDHAHEETPVSVRSVLRELHAFYLTNLTFKRSIQWEERVPEHIPPVVLQPYLLVEPIMHILNNAIDTLGEFKEGTITISTIVRESRTLTIDIQNSGPAVLPDIPFEGLLETGRTTRFNVPGCGLSFAAWLVTEAGGSLSLTENKEGHVTFSLIYPLQQK